MLLPFRSTACFVATALLSITLSSTLSNAPANADSDGMIETSTYEQDAIEVARITTAFIHGAANIRRLTIDNVRVVSTGNTRNALVKLSWRTEKKNVLVNSVVSFSMIDRNDLHRIFRLQYHDTLAPVKHPEALLRLRSQLNELLEIEDRISPPVLSSAGQPSWPMYNFVPANEPVENEPVKNQD